MQMYEAKNVEGRDIATARPADRVWILLLLFMLLVASACPKDHATSYLHDTVYSVVAKMASQPATELPDATRTLPMLS